MKIILVIMFSFIVSAFSVCADDVKEADLAGSWYPESAAELSLMIEGYLSAANPEPIPGDIVGIISPHAGYLFSGPVAAYSYKILRDKAFKTVILLGFSHRKPFDGIAIYDKGFFNTPLGKISVNSEMAEFIKSGSDRISFHPEIFNDENSVETQIPFIQITCKGASVVPIAFGSQNYRDVQILADILALLLKGRNDVVIIASTDLSHYLSYDESVKIDSRFIEIFNNMKSRDMYDYIVSGACQACGVMPVCALMLISEKLGYSKRKVLKYANSGDTYGDKARVVGYLSAVFYNEAEDKIRSDSVKEDKSPEGDMMLNSTQKKRLLDIARRSVTSLIRDKKRENFIENDPLLNEPMGAFVTLHEDGRLRGCIGNIVGSGPLYKTVSDMAIEAATADPRFRPLSADEIDKVDIEISVLSPLRRVSGADEIKIPGHGVLVKRGFSGGVYLPQVATETGWSKEEFLTSLCGEKAGIEPGAWKSGDTELYVFSAFVFGEKNDR